jgi:hypothetical protein
MTGTITYPPPSVSVLICANVRKIRKGVGSVFFVVFLAPFFLEGIFIDPPEL